MSNRQQLISLGEAGRVTEFLELFTEGFDGLSGSQLDELADTYAGVDGVYISTVYRKGGGEGEGDSVVRVYSFVVDPEVITKSKYHVELVGGTNLLFVRATGSYSSYEGTEWDSTYTQVIPLEVQVTQYFSEAELKRRQP